MRAFVIEKGSRLAEVFTVTLLLSTVLGMRVLEPWLVMLAEKSQTVEVSGSPVRCQALFRSPLGIVGSAACTVCSASQWPPQGASDHSLSWPWCWSWCGTRHHSRSQEWALGSKLAVIPKSSYTWCEMKWSTQRWCLMSIPSQGLTWNSHGAATTLALCPQNLDAWWWACTISLP